MARITNLKAQLVFGGARPTDFEVQFINPVDPSGDLKAAFLCKSAQIPQSQLGEVPLLYHGQPVYFAGNRTFEPWTVTIINDTDFTIRDSFERWMNGINAHSANTGLTNPVDYQSDLLVDQLDRDESVIKRYTFRGAFPTVVGPITLDYDQRDQIETFDVTFSYQYWESNTTSKWCTKYKGVFGLPYIIF